jgi:hypothetical protein
MKSLNDIKQDMSILYDELRAGSIDLKTAAELANVAGKFLKAEQLDLATAIFLEGKSVQPVKQVGNTIHQIEKH